MGTNMTDTYEEHCEEIEHPDVDEKEGSGGDDDGEEEGRIRSVNGTPDF